MDVIEVGLPAHETGEEKTGIIQKNSNIHGCPNYVVHVIRAIVATYPRYRVYSSI